MPDRDHTVLERLAVARLQHTVNELQNQVENDRKLTPPTRRIFHCVTDETALTASIPDLKQWVADRGMTMVVPLAVLDALDKLKKGTDDVNVGARETIRYLDRVQNPRSKIIRGVLVQSPTERFDSWAEVTAKRPAVAPSPDSEGEADAEPDAQGPPPAHVQALLNCAVFLMHTRSLKKPDANSADVVLVTNDGEVAKWARTYDINTATTAQLAEMLAKEEVEFTERQRHYDYAVSNGNSKASTSSPVRARGGGMRLERGGAGAGGGRGGRRGRRDSRGGDDSELFNPSASSGSQRGRGGGGHRGGAQQQHQQSEYVLRGPSRGVARGRGKLWEP